MTRKESDPYVVLGIGRQASAPEISRAYRRAARVTHPDSSPAGSASAERFQAISDAYETLRDPQRRAAYDRAHPSVSRHTPPVGSIVRSSVQYARPGGQHIVLGSRRPPGP
jgi:curved DNA-binding protein CbpA